MKHPARVPIIGYQNVKGIAGLVPVYSRTCYDCGRPVRMMTGRGGVFWHAAGNAGPDDPRRGPRRPEHSAAISAGMRAATARRKAARTAVHAGED